MRAFALFLIAVAPVAASEKIPFDPVESRISRLVRPDHKVQTAKDAVEAVISSFPDTPWRKTLFGGVAALTRAPVEVKGRLERGATIWIVEVASAAASDVAPIPEGIFWVSAKDGAVYLTTPKREKG